MSARSPGSLMFRAATAASGGTGAPFATYCSIWAWTVRMSAWTSTPSGLASGSSSMTARRYGSGAEEPWARGRRRAWASAAGRAEVRLGRGEAVDAEASLALDDRADRPVLELHDLGDLGQRADGVELGG